MAMYDAQKLQIKINEQPVVQNEQVNNVPVVNAPVNDVHVNNGPANDATVPDGKDSRKSVL